MPGPGGQGGSLLDLMDQGAPPPPPSQFPVIPPGMNFGGVAGSMFGGGGAVPIFSPSMADPYVAANAGMVREDFESPLGYTQPNWQPRDTGGFFTIGDLYRNFQQPSVGYSMGPRRPGEPAQGARTVAPQSPSDLFQLGAEAPSTNNWRLLGRGPGWIMRNGQIINAMTPQARQGLPMGYDPSFSDTAESGVANYPRTVGAGGALTGRNVFDAYYWPGGDIMGRTRWPYKTDV